jgi:PAS domain S-box-containing protein
MSTRHENTPQDPDLPVPDDDREREAEDRAKITDVTQSKHAEDRLRISEERLRLALDGGQTGMWEWDLQSNQTVWNERGFELLGLAPEDGPLTGDRFLEYIHPEDRPRVQRAVEEILARGDHFREEFRIVRADGQVRWLASVARLHRDAGGEPRKLVGVNFDVTAQKQAENELRALKEDLEQQVAERTSALRLLRDVASMANRTQSVEEALEYCLRRVCEHNGWSFGHAFLPADDDPERLLPAYAWYPAEAERFRAFRALTLKTSLRSGECLPGRVFASGEPDWTTDVPGEFGARRVELAEDLGIVTAAAFPVMVESRVVVVLNGVTAVFHRPHPRPETRKGVVDAVRQFLINAGVEP